MGEVIKAVLAYVLRATTKKRSSTFLGKKITPTDKNLATPKMCKCRFASK